MLANLRGSPLTARMFDSIRRLFSSGQPARPSARVPDGERWYVIGDIHGRRDLLEALQQAIETDDAGGSETTVVFLGDLVDRGPDSKGVVRLARKWGETRKVRYLAGNHEEMFLQSFEDKEVLRHFLKHGGRETVLSYGIDKKAYSKMKMGELQDAMHAAVPRKHREFLESFEDLIVAGDYVLVHAGINPKLGIEEQKKSDLRWIRDRFLSHEEPFSHVVVHGHTIFEDVEHRDYRIGIDTGAFRTGRLTALVLEGSERRLIQAIASDDGAIRIEKVDA